MLSCCIVCACGIELVILGLPASLFCNKKTLLLLNEIRACGTFEKKAVPVQTIHVAYETKNYTRKEKRKTTHSRLAAVVRSCFVLRCVLLTWRDASNAGNNY